MKILIDPVYTQRPEVCSTSYLAWELIEQLAKWRPDVYFYLLYPPDSVSEETSAFLSRHADRVTLLPLRQSISDRAGELYTMRDALKYYLSSWSAETWDTDVVLSSRIPIIKHMRVHAARQQGVSMPSYRAHIGLEEMPILPFRDTVPWSQYQYPDTLMSYGMADAVIVNHQWLKSRIRPVLREVLSPAYQKQVLDNIHEAVPVRLERLNLRPPEQMYQSGPFKLTFVGRMTNTRNFAGVTELFRKQFSYPLGKNKQEMEFLVSTNSTSAGASDFGEIDFIDIQKNNREQFHSFLKDAHVAVNLTPVEDFSLSTYETLLRGVPLIVYDKPWNAFLGPDYPFRAHSELEAYTMVNAFAADYSSMYEMFRKWEANWWADYVAGPLNITTSDVLIKLLTDFDTRRNEQIVGRGGSFREVAEKLTKESGTELDLTAYLKADGVPMVSLEDMNPSYSVSTARFPLILVLKAILHEMGWRDTQRCGYLVR